MTYEAGGMEMFEMPGSTAPMYELPAREEVASELASPVPELASPGLELGLPALELASPALELVSPALELAAPALEPEETSKYHENT